MTDLDLVPLDEPETLDDIEAELDSIAAEHARVAAAQIEPEPAPKPEPEPAPETAPEPRTAGMIDGYIAKVPAIALNATWKKFKLGELSPEEIQLLDAASLQALLSYAIPDLPKWLQDLIDSLLKIVGPWDTVIKLMFALTAMKIINRRADNALNVTPRPEPEPKKEDHKSEAENVKK